VKIEFFACSQPGQAGTKKEYRIMNKEHRISKEGGASRHILNRAFGAPSFDIPCSIFDIRYYFFSFPSAFF
jgi:hypothetical protein